MKKNLSEAEIRNAVALIAKSGLESVKFYGMVGLPHETQADLDETVRLMQALKKEHRHLRFVFGVSSFVPKAQTPYQWNGRMKDCKARLEYIRKNLAKVGIEVRIENEGLPSLDDRGLRVILFRAVREQLLDAATRAGTRLVWVRLGREERSLRVCIESHGELTATPDTLPRA